MIKPTPGRVVWYRPFTSDSFATAGPDPLAAIVARVWSDSCVNLMVIDANGITHSKTSVLLVQGDGDRPESGFCEWIPYQKGQAAKAEIEKETV